MNSIEACRDHLATRYPDRTVFVEASARYHQGRIQIEYSISILPGFNFETCQRFTGPDLAECMTKLNRLATAPQPGAQAEGWRA